MNQQELRSLARLGAAARLAQLEQERAALLRTFPGLRAASTGASGTEATDGANAPRAGKRGRRRNRMSAAARKAVSQRMTRYWAERRKAKASKPARAAKSTQAAKTARS